MERLTEKHFAENGHYMKCSGENPECDGHCGNCKELEMIVDRLAAYEDTGMDPDEINDLREFCESQTSTTLAHIYELVQAEREGRLVVTHITEKTMQALECMATQAHSGIEGRAPAKEG